MQRKVEGEVVIVRPIEEVFDFVADECNRYDPRIQRAEKLTDGPIGRGTRFLSETKIVGGTAGMAVEITEYVRPRRLATSTETSGARSISTRFGRGRGSAGRRSWSRAARSGSWTDPGADWAPPGRDDLRAPEASAREGRVRLRRAAGRRIGSDRMRL